MIEQKTVIDSNGFVIERNVLFKDGESQFYELKEGEKAVELLTKAQTVNGNIVGYLKPKWNGTEWIETATQDELNIAYPLIKQQPTTDETLSKEVANLKIDSMKKDLIITNALQTIASLKVQIMGLKGGI